MLPSSPPDFHSLNNSVKSWSEKERKKKNRHGEGDVLVSVTTPCSLGLTALGPGLRSHSRHGFGTALFSVLWAHQAHLISTACPGWVFGGAGECRRGARACRQTATALPIADIDKETGRQEGMNFQKLWFQKSCTPCVRQLMPSCCCDSLARSDSKREGS